jgi:hypothetical protein
MKGGKPGQTDWSKLDLAPLRKHYGDFAELARQVALRYPDIRHYVVWNEFKGFWNEKLNNWDYQAYTRLYNQVYDALKSVNPKIKVGGPYLTIEGTGTETGQWWAERPIRERNRQALEYWLEHKHGADFLVIDRGVPGPHDTNTYAKEQLLALTPLFGDITRQLRQMTKLPIWWAESNFVQDDDPRFEAVGLASMLYHEVVAGASVSMRWSPQAQPGGEIGQNLFTDTQEPGGGQPLPAYDVYKLYHDYFGLGTWLYPAKSSAPDIEVLASAKRTLLINKRARATVASVNGERVVLQGYEVRLLTGLTQ